MPHREIDREQHFLHDGPKVMARRSVVCAMASALALAQVAGAEEVGNVDVDWLGNDIVI